MMLDVTWEELGMLRAGLSAWRCELDRFAMNEHDSELERLAAVKAAAALALMERLAEVEIAELRKAGR